MAESFQSFEDGFANRLGDGLKTANAEETSRRLKACQEAALADKMFVLADFDRTITRCFLADGSRGSSAHGVMEGGGVFSEEFVSKTKDLFDKYYPIEIDAKMTIADKIPIMNEWYSQVHALYLKEDISRTNIAAAVAGCSSIQLRDGIVDVLRFCQDANPPIPFLVMSAGLGDVIEEFLRQQLSFPLAPTTMVVSNRMQFDDTGRLTGFSEPLLHMFNKTAAFFPSDARQLVADRQSCLLLGDGLGDLTMADGLDIQKLSVGFLNEKIEERLPQYLDGFDVVVLGDRRVPDICFSALGRAESSKPATTKTVGSLCKAESVAIVAAIAGFALLMFVKRK